MSDKQSNEQGITSEGKPIEETYWDENFDGILEIILLEKDRLVIDIFGRTITIYKKDYPLQSRRQCVAVTVYHTGTKPLGYLAGTSCLYHPDKNPDKEKS